MGSADGYGVHLSFLFGDGEGIPCNGCIFILCESLTGY